MQTSKAKEQRPIPAYERRSADGAWEMREILGMDTQEICATVGITHETCSAMLCRARLAVRDRLERDWFAAQKVQ